MRQDRNVTTRASASRDRVLRRALIGLPVAVALTLTACSSGGSTPTPTDTGTGTPATSNPLNGLPTPVGPALAVKVANTPDARPPSGLPAAGQVWVEEIEGGWTRLIPIYSGTYPDKIGPVRSGRESDIGLVPQFGKPGFAFAGADAPVLTAVATADDGGLLIDLGKDATVGGVKIRDTAYATDPTRTVPYNFYGVGSALARFADKGGAFDPPTGFTFGATASTGTACSTLAITWSRAASGGARWDEATAKWVITFDGQDLIDRESGRPQTATNIVVLRMKDAKSEINRSEFAVPVLESYGPDGGDAIVLGSGSCTTSRWDRPTQTSPTTLASTNGRPITLSPGQTWVFTVGLGPTLAPDGTERTATTS